MIGVQGVAVTVATVATVVNKCGVELQSRIPWSHPGSWYRVKVALKGQNSSGHLRATAV